MKTWQYAILAMSAERSGDLMAAAEMWEMAAEACEWAHNASWLVARSRRVR